MVTRLVLVQIAQILSSDDGAAQKIGIPSPSGSAIAPSYLIKAKAFGPKVLINVMGGADQVASLKQFVQFGLDKQMAVGGALFELESIRAVPDDTRVGWWTMEWWWDQPDVPHV